MTTERIWSTLFFPLIHRWIGNVTIDREELHSTAQLLPIAASDARYVRLKKSAITNMTCFHFGVRKASLVSEKHEKTTNECVEYSTIDDGFVGGMID